jgi:hypothetical protein
MKKYKGFEIGHARQTGGKAGTGFNKTSTIQITYRVNSESYLLIKNIRFNVGTPDETRAAVKTAIQKAMDYVDSGEAMKKVKACGC